MRLSNALNLLPYDADNRSQYKCVIPCGRWQITYYVVLLGPETTKKHDVTIHNIKHQEGIYAVFNQAIPCECFFFLE